MRFAKPGLLSLVLCLAVGIPTALDTTADARAIKPSLHGTLTKADRDLLIIGGHGRGVVQRLGAKLPEAARRNEMSTARLRATLLEDHSAWIGPSGGLYYK